MIVDDHSMVRQGLQMYFEGDPEVEIIGEARNGEEALRLAATLNPQVVLMDLLMPVVDGFQAIKALRKLTPLAHVIAMTSVVEESGVHRAIEAGAISYVLKDTRPDELRDAVLAAAEGRVRFSPESAGRLMQAVPTPDVDPDTLNGDERRMLTLLAAGHSSAEIGAALDCSAADVDATLNALLARLSLAGRAQAVLYATRKGLVSSDLRPYLV
jgi:NarL family two-component system response regulator LiaR